MNVYIFDPWHQIKTNNCYTSDTLGGEDITWTLYYKFKYGKFFYISMNSIFIQVPRTNKMSFLPYLSLYGPCLRCRRSQPPVQILLLSYEHAIKLTRRKTSLILFSPYRRSTPHRRSTRQSQYSDTLSPVLILLLLYFPNILLKPLKTNHYRRHQMVSV